MVSIPTGQAILAFESSADQASAAIIADGIARQHVHAARHGHAALITELARAALEEAGLSAREVTHVAAGRGPGSFTGIRVALAAAKGLRLPPVPRESAFPVLPRWRRRRAMQGRSLVTGVSSRPSTRGAAASSVRPLTPTDRWQTPSLKSMASRRWIFQKAGPGRQSSAPGPTRSPADTGQKPDRRRDGGAGRAAGGAARRVPYAGRHRAGTADTVICGTGIPWPARPMIRPVETRDLDTIAMIESRLFRARSAGGSGAAAGTACQPRFRFRGYRWPG